MCGGHGTGTIWLSTQAMQQLANKDEFSCVWQRLTVHYFLLCPVRIPDLSSCLTCKDTLPAPDSSSHGPRLHTHTHKHSQNCSWICLSQRLFCSWSYLLCGQVVSCFLQLKCSTEMKRASLLQLKDFEDGWMDWVDSRGLLCPKSLLLLVSMLSSLLICILQFAHLVQSVKNILYQISI